MKKKKHRHEWGTLKTNERGKIVCIKCKTCGKVSFPNKPILKTKGVFGKNNV